MIRPEAILSFDFGHPEPSDARNAILYALGLGLGADPLSRADLRFLDERNLTVLLTFAVTLCSPGIWIRDPKLGVDFERLVHLAQGAEFPEPLPPAARVRGTANVVSLTDWGEGRGAVLELERTIADVTDGRLYCRLRQTLLLRGDGGFGGKPAAREIRFKPDRPADATHRLVTSPRAALIYRLSGDWNPLHIDPDIAAAAGFPRPILHGLASYGMAGIADSCALDRDPASIAALFCRFYAPVLPGDAIDFAIWHDGEMSARFEARVGDRKVLDNGTIRWRQT